MPLNIDYLFLCHLHFKTEDLIATPSGYQKFCLKQNAVPFFESPQVHQQTGLQYHRKKYCKIVDCVNYNVGVPRSSSVHMFR